MLVRKYFKGTNVFYISMSLEQIDVYSVSTITTLIQTSRDIYTETSTLMLQIVLYRPTRRPLWKIDEEQFKLSFGLGAFHFMILS